jgi:hypothetical protein
MLKSLKLDFVHAASPITSKFRVHLFPHLLFMKIRDSHINILEKWLDVKHLANVPAKPKQIVC